MQRDYQHWGTIKKTKGIEGALVIERILPNLPAPQATHIWISQGRSYIPYRILALNLDEETSYGLLQLKQIANREEAKKIVQKKIYIEPEPHINAYRASQGWDLIGYALYTSQKKYIGEISSVTPRPYQPLLHILIGTHESLLPYHHDILTIDRKQKKIIIEEKWIR